MIRGYSHQGFSHLVFCLIVSYIAFGSNFVSAAEWAPAAVKVLVAYHSQSGNTERMAEAVVEGAKSLADTMTHRMCTWRSYRRIPHESSKRSAVEVDRGLLTLSSKVREIAPSHRCSRFD